MILTATTYNHTQDVADDVWSIVHNLNTTSPIVDCYILIDGSYTKILPTDVKVIDSTTVEVHWSDARVGKARVI